ncbi:MAG: alpha-ketoglutarate-dependent dioxygenase AlkB [Patescibacteria group bacterium]
MRGRGADQYPLFDFGQAYPNGFTYHSEFITASEEAALIACIQKLELTPAPFREYTAKRRIMSFGWTYDPDTLVPVPGESLPDFLLPLAHKVGNLVGIAGERVVEALITEYRPGTGVGWHRDNESFDKIIGISLAGWCRFDMRPWSARDDTEMISVTVEPRSAYVMQDESRWDYKHRVAPTKGLRYSITFRTLASR